MHTTQPIRTASRLQGRTVLRRNGQARLAGAGYAAITSLWLGLLLVSTPSAAYGIAEGILALLGLLGLGLAVYRDNLIVDSTSRTLILAKGIPGFTRETHYAFGDFDGIMVEETAFNRHEEEASRPSPHIAYSASFVNSTTGTRLKIWDAETEDHPDARARLAKQARQHAEAVADVTGHPLRSADASVRSGTVKLTE